MSFICNDSHYFLLLLFVSILNGNKKARTRPLNFPKLLFFICLPVATMPHACACFQSGGQGYGRPGKLPDWTESFTARFKPSRSEALAVKGAAVEYVRRRTESGVVASRLISCTFIPG
jgi:hypothetical protein